MKNKFILLTLTILLVGCGSDYTKRYIVTKSDDNNWSTSGIIECDSVNMESKNKAIIWVDGHKMNIEGGLIKIFTNKNYEK